MSPTTRRGFIGAFGAAAAGAAVAAPVELAFPWASPRVVGAMSLPEAVASWRKAHDALVAQFRPAYLTEVVRFAEELRPQFEAGELYGYGGDDSGEGRERLEELCAERFGLVVERLDEAPYYVGDSTTATLINAVSPFAPRWVAMEDWNHPSYCAKACAADDVLAAAARGGFYVPCDDECEPPAAEVLS